MLSLAACGPSERPPCDERALSQAVQELEDSSAAGAEAQAIDALIEACPTINSGIVQEARLAYTDYTDYQRGSPLSVDPRLRYMYRTLCVDIDGLERDVRTLPAAEQAAAMYEVCELDRFGLLESTEVFMTDDLPGFFLYGWLLGRDIDPALARRFARGLMRSTATPLIAQRRCRADPNDYGCVIAARAEGIGLPDSTSPWMLETWLPEDSRGDDDVTRISVSPTSLRVDGEQVAALVDGQFAETSLDGRSVLSLRDAIPPMSSGFVIWADRTLATGVLLRVLFTAASSDDQFALVVEGMADTRVIPLSVSTRWTAHTWVPRREDVRARVDIGGVHMIRPHVEPRFIPIEDIAAIEDAARNIATERGPRIALSVADFVPVGQLVAVLDALRGQHCWFNGFEMGGECYLSAPSVDFDPPLPRRRGDWSRLELSVTSAHREPGRRGPKSVAQHQAAIEAALPSIQTCLRESWLATEEMPEWMAYSFKAHGQRGFIVRPFAPHLADPELSTCLIEAIGGTHGESDEDSYAMIELTIDLPEQAAADQNR